MVKVALVVGLLVALNACSPNNKGGAEPTPADADATAGSGKAPIASGGQPPPSSPTGTPAPLPTPVPEEPASQPTEPEQPAQPTEPTQPVEPTEPAPPPPTPPSPTASPAKFSANPCVDPPLGNVLAGTALTLCDATQATGVYAPAPLPCPNALPVDDYNGSLPYPTGSACPLPVWRLFCDATPASPCLAVDTTTRLAWTELPAADPILWQDAVSGCESLAIAGFTDWRLPTQKDLMTAYVHGIRSVDSPRFAGNLHRWSWADTTGSENRYVAWRVDTATGAVGIRGKKNADAFALCIRNVN